MNILYTIAWVLGRVLLWLYRVETRGAGELPQNGVLLCPNHASDIDPVLIALCLPRRYCLHFMAKAELFEKPFVSCSSARSARFPFSATERISSPSRRRCRCCTRARTC